MVSYIHMGYKAGVILGLNKSEEKFKDAGRDVAMQVVAGGNQSPDKDGVMLPSRKEIEIEKNWLRKASRKICWRKLNWVTQQFFQRQHLAGTSFCQGQ
jgi:elongation factor Ts